MAILIFRSCILSQTSIVVKDPFVIPTKLGRIKGEADGDGSLREGDLLLLLALRLSLYSYR